MFHISTSRILKNLVVTDLGNNFLKTLLLFLNFNEKLFLSSQSVSPILMQIVKYLLKNTSEYLKSTGP